VRIIGTKTKLYLAWWRKNDEGKKNWKL